MCPKERVFRSDGSIVETRLRRRGSVLLRTPVGCLQLVVIGGPSNSMPKAAILAASLT
jgi:hypothetical protein